MNKKIKKGFTLVELIVAMAIVAIILSSVVPMLLLGYKQIIASGNKNISAVSAQKKVEDTLAGNVNNYTNVTLTDKGNSTINMTFNGVSYEVTGNNIEIDYSGKQPFKINTFKPN